MIEACLRLLRIALVRVAIFLVPILFLFFIVFLIGLFSKTEIVSYRASTGDKVKVFWLHSVYGQWYAVSVTSGTKDCRRQ